jgi:hypothetical protein
MKVKLVNAMRYVGPGTNGDVVEKGAILELEGAELDNALALSNFDESNNEHFLFEKYDGKDDEEDEPKDGHLEEIGVKPKRTRKVA